MDCGIVTNVGSYDLAKNIFGGFYETLSLSLSLILSLMLMALPVFTASAQSIEQLRANTTDKNILEFYEVYYAVDQVMNTILADYKVKADSYKKDVAAYNKSKTQEAYEALTKQKEALDKESAEIDPFLKAYNSFIDEYNKMNKAYTDARKAKENNKIPLFTQDPAYDKLQDASKALDSFRYENIARLKTLLADITAAKK